ncbi:unnamed protein product [Euphydryas editha]|uniref:Uncharacterized protein n=1 Tax=Euphydryas editha TaxID=104508 RepID=A0AAU9UNJ3_EUPED|nr:unnamed protein product [Euphydryas editha]
MKVNVFGRILFFDTVSYVFYNIHYATARTGQERLKAPLPPSVWSQPFEGVEKDINMSSSLLHEIISTK